VSTKDEQLAAIAYELLSGATLLLFPRNSRAEFWCGDPSRPARSAPACSSWPSRSEGHQINRQGAIIATLKYEPEKRKLETEATTMLNNSSLEIATRVNVRVDVLSTEIDRVDREQGAQRELLHVDSDRDREPAREARTAGIAVSKPQALFLYRQPAA
jgi:hypothetical protein